MPNKHSPRRAFNSFWMGGFEGADHVNGSGVALNPNHANGHATRLDEDYAALAALGIRTVRESVGWRLFSAQGAIAGMQRITAQAQVAARHNIEIIWTLMHYGWPPSLDPFHRPQEFINTFAAYCLVVADVLREVDGPPPVFQPINEISFLSWAASMTGLIHPHTPTSTARGDALKRTLVRAALRGCDAIWSVQPDARIVHTDPLIHVAAPPDATDEVCRQAAASCEAQFAAWDMLCGKLEPELVGDPRYLDVPGVNYYHDNQWDHVSSEVLDWHQAHPRRQSFSQLAGVVWQRYGRPVLISETGHVGEGRARWLDELAREVLACKAQNILIEGICLYPVLDRHDWENPGHWHHSGLWDLPYAASGDLTRHPDIPFQARLRYWKTVLPAPAQNCLSTLPGAFMTHLIVFSHLRWDFVYQRPQQLLSRLASRCEYPVVFIEEPIVGAAHPWLETMTPEPNVTVLRAHVTGTHAGFHDDHLPLMQRVIDDYLNEQQIKRYMLWFYTPMALPFADGLSPSGIIYDCMDELTAFRYAPRQLVQRENVLFKKADLVFTGGRSLYEAKRERHEDVHCFPSSVDHAHFGGVWSDHPDQVGVAHPRLGYYGVIDERLDLELIATLADAHPEWNIVMVGPVLKVEQASLPQRANIHWMGQRHYVELPQFLSGWDVCLLPFALNDSTRFISPTKTLEYLAAGKPAVSTAIRDVAATYSHVIPIAQSHIAFVAACEAILLWSPSQLKEFESEAAAAVASTSWDSTVDAMDALMKRVGSAPAALPLEDQQDNASAELASEGVVYFPTAIHGTGHTGLPAASELSDNARLIER